MKKNYLKNLRFQKEKHGDGFAYGENDESCHEQTDVDGH